MSDLPDLIIVLLTGNGSSLLEALYSIRHQGGAVLLQPPAVSCGWLRRVMAGRGWWRAFFHGDLRPQKGRAIFILRERCQGTAFGGMTLPRAYDLASRPCRRALGVHFAIPVATKGRTRVPSFSCSTISLLGNLGLGNTQILNPGLTHYVYFGVAGSNLGPSAACLRLNHLTKDRSATQIWMAVSPATGATFGTPVVIQTGFQSSLSSPGARFYRLRAAYSAD